MSGDAADIEAARKLFAGPCDFIWGAETVHSLPETSLPEVAFVGRSNVGKSSLVNALTGRKTLARVSQTPGVTRKLNFFNLANRLMLVDLPGYGYAKASKAQAAEWQAMAFAYMRGRPQLVRVFVLLDARRGAGPSDIEVMDMLDRAAVSYGLVLTKMDEMDRPADAVAGAQAEAARHTAALVEVMRSSAQTGDGIAALRARLAALALP